MRKRPKTWKFSEYAPQDHGSPPEEYVTVTAKPGGRLAKRRPGNPWPVQAKAWRESAQELLDSVRDLIKAGSSYADVAKLLDIPESVVAEFGLEV